MTTATVEAPVTLPPCPRFAVCGNTVRLDKRGKPAKYCSDNCRMRTADEAYKARREQAGAEQATEEFRAAVKTEVTRRTKAARPRIVVERPDQPAIPVRAHRGKFLATYAVGGRTLYRYGPTAVEAEARMREAITNAIP
jgi:hypothetical protein